MVEVEPPVRTYFTYEKKVPIPSPPLSGKSSAPCYSRFLGQPDYLPYGIRHLPPCNTPSFLHALTATEQRNVPTSTVWKKGMNDDALHMMIHQSKKILRHTEKKTPVIASHSCANKSRSQPGRKEAQPEVLARIHCRSEQRGLARRSLPDGKSHTSQGGRSRPQPLPARTSAGRSFRWHLAFTIPVSLPLEDVVVDTSVAPYLLAIFYVSLGTIVSSSLRVVSAAPTSGRNGGLHYGESIFQSRFTLPRKLGLAGFT